MAFGLWLLGIEWWSNLKSLAPSGGKIGFLLASYHYILLRDTYEKKVDWTFFFLFRYELVLNMYMLLT